MKPPRRPTRAEILAAANKTVRDVIAPHLRILFCGINPGLYTAAVGHHFARPGNRFWPVLHLAGFTERILLPHEERELLRRGLGLTNVAPRATATAGELSATELAEGARRLTAKVQRYRPQWVAVLGVGAYRIAFARPRAVPGPQRETIGDTRIWVLPNPSGLNAHYQLPDLIRLFGELREWVRDARSPGASRWSRSPTT
jgi:double-stranded uracil-DNA glycosylase